MPLNIPSPVQGQISPIDPSGSLLAGAQTAGALRKEQEIPGLLERYRGGDEGALMQIAQLDPQMAQSIVGIEGAKQKGALTNIQVQQAQQEIAQDQMKREMQALGGLKKALAGVKSPQEKTKIKKMYIERAKKMGIDSHPLLDGDWTPEMGEDIDNLFAIGSQMIAEEGAPFTLGPGETRFGAGGKPVATVAPKPEKIAPAARQAATYAVRSEQSGNIIDTLGEQFTGVTSRAVGAIPQGLRSEDRQKFDQATRNFINATLRRESGATISPSEFESAEMQYIPQPGDGDEVLLQKKANRKAVIEGLALEGGEAFKQLKAKIPKKTITVKGKEYSVGQTFTNNKGQSGILNADGSITILE